MPEKINPREMYILNVAPRVLARAQVGESFYKRFSRIAGRTRHPYSKSSVYLITLSVYRARALARPESDLFSRVRKRPALVSISRGTVVRKLGARTLSKIFADRVMQHARWRALSERLERISARRSLRRSITERARPNIVPLIFQVAGESRLWG